MEILLPKKSRVKTNLSANSNLLFPSSELIRYIKIGGLNAPDSKTHIAQVRVACYLGLTRLSGSFMGAESRDQPFPLPT